jgi:hypothetical protein
MTLFRRRLARAMRTSGRSATIPSPAVRSGRSTGASSSRSPIGAIVCSTKLSEFRHPAAGLADMLKFGFPLVFVALAVSAARADTMVCTTDAGVTHCEAPLRHYRVTGTRDGNRTYFEDNKGRRWMMIEENGRTTIIPR